EVRCFTFTSSIAVYGTNQLPMREDLTPLPEDSYGIAKAAVELELKASHELFGLDYVVFRPHNVYGERQNLGDKYRNVIGIFMNRLMQGESLPIFPIPPSTPLPEGLRRMARWAKASGIRQSREFEGIEIHKNLPPAWIAVVLDEPVGAGAAG